MRGVNGLYTPVLEACNVCPHDAVFFTSFLVIHVHSGQWFQCFHDNELAAMHLDAETILYVKLYIAMVIFLLIFPKKWKNLRV